jgi:hypothetical protein
MNKSLSTLVGKRSTRVGLALVCSLVAAALLVPLILPYGPADQLDLANKQLLSPRPAHPGCRLLSRLSRYSCRSPWVPQSDWSRAFPVAGLTQL